MTSFADQMSLATYANGAWSADRLVPVAPLPICTVYVSRPGVRSLKLAGGSGALALLGNTLATGAILFVLITMLGPISGAHMNPAVSLVAAWRGGVSWGAAPRYILVQIAGAFAGECERRCPPDACACSRHQRDLSTQIKQFLVVDGTHCAGPCGWKRRGVDWPA